MGNRNPVRDIFCFGGKYVALWHPKGVSVAIRLFRASQWERGRARLSLLPCPPTGTDGHPRSSLISLQSGNDPCSWDVAALFKYDARCSPTFSMSSHCPRKPWGEREKERESTTSHNAACVMGCCAYSPFPCSCFAFCLLALTHPAERDRHRDLKCPRPWEVTQFRLKDSTQSTPEFHQKLYKCNICSHVRAYMQLNRNRAVKF